jgi:hypothetical protein
VNAVETAQIAGAAFVGIGVVIALFQVLATQKNERKRSQPIVIAHEDRPRHFDSLVPAWKVQAHATNEGEGAAFNVRWGVAYYGVRHAFRLHDKDPYPGNRQRVIHPRESFPPKGSAEVVISSVEMIAGEAVPEEDAFYWARYENAQGQTWETINRPERTADLKIKRIRFALIRERLETRKRRRYLKKGWAQDRKMGEDLLALKEPTEKEGEQ